MSQHGVVYTRLMNCPEWRRIRERQLFQMPYCEMCLGHGVVRSDKTMVVHHVVEVETGRTEAEQRSLAYAETTYLRNGHGQVVYDAKGAPVRLSGNLMTLCTRCHSKIHQERRSHSKKVHKERAESRLQAWLSEQMGQSVADKEKSPQNEEKPPP